MRKACPLLLFFILLPAVFSSEDWLYKSNQAKFVVEVSQDAKVIRFDDPLLESATAILDFFPRDDSRQKVTTLITFPESTASFDTIVYQWSKPKEDVLTFSLYSHVVTTSKFFPINQKVDFPILYSGPELEKFLAQTLYIDFSNPKIRELADELSKDEDDLFDVCFSLAEWVHANIQYEPTPETVNFAQKASWVLEQRKGVCDEMTTLFIALARSLGIPAKFVSGLALGGNGEFATHAWPEVYFQGFGWIPFDVTNREYGYLDVSHIKLRESVDADVPSSRFEWVGQDVDLDRSELKVDADALQTQGDLQPRVSVQLLPVFSQLGESSLGLVQASLMNENPYYVVLVLRASSMLDVLQPEQAVLLHPNEKKTVFWVVQAPEFVNGKASFSVFVNDNFNFTAFLELGSDFKVFSEQEVYQEMDNRKGNDKLPDRSRIQMQCIPASPEFYPDERFVVNCIVNNPSNEPMQAVLVCLEQDCHNLSLEPKERKSSAFEVKESQLLFTASFGSASRENNLTLRVLDLPSLRIMNISYPERVQFGKDYSIGFSLKKTSHDNPRNVLVIVDSAGETRSFELKELNSTRDYFVQMKGNSLLDQPGDFKIVASYYDLHNRRYEDEKSFSLKLEGLSFSQRIRVLYLKAISKLSSFF
ncbi:MAG: transglutaminase-like domain-containing protein [Candidatus Woesearchaeota archaeon]